MQIDQNSAIINARSGIWELITKFYPIYWETNGEEKVQYVLLGERINKSQSDTDVQKVNGMGGSIS